MAGGNFTRAKNGLTFEGCGGEGGHMMFVVIIMRVCGSPGFFPPPEASLCPHVAIRVDDAPSRKPVEGFARPIRRPPFFTKLELRPFRSQGRERSQPPRLSPVGKVVYGPGWQCVHSEGVICCFGPPKVFPLFFSFMK